MRNLQSHLVLLFAFSLLIVTGCSKKQTWTLTSPDENVTITVTNKTIDSLKTDRLFYTVELKNGSSTTTVIEESPLGLVRDDQSFAENLKLVSAGTVTVIDETYTMLVGKQLENRNHANEVVLTFENAAKAKMELILRAYNDGVAFRYRFPETDSTVHTVTDELTGFNLPVDGKAWIQPYDKATEWSPAYETFFRNNIAIGDTSPGPEGWSFPALFNANNAWVLLTAADIDASYCGVHLCANPVDGLYTVKFPEAGETLGMGDVAPKYTLPWQMPWRVIMVSNTLAGITQSNLVHHVSTPNQIADVSWIKPGVAGWSWWGDWDSPKDYKKLVTWVDFCANMGWPYFLVDANWDIMKGGTIDQLVKYANSKNVGILMWYNSGGPHNKVTERPRDIMNNPEARKAEFKKLQEWGVKGVKVDFFQSDKQFMMEEYMGILKDAAEYHILVNFHGCTLPWGWARTWPNLISQESVFGEEAYGFNEKYPEMARVCNTILPFTRNVVGSMDYTPVAFSDNKFPHLTSNAHELALSVVFESGILHVADRYWSIEQLPEAPKNFLKTVPTTWDETLLVDGEPGTRAVFARRKGASWYVGGIVSDTLASELTVDLSFLADGEHKALLIADGDTNRSFKSTEQTVKKGDKLTVKLQPVGGFVIKID